MMVDLGGPGTPCSAMRVRRLLAGELQGAERERTQAHVDGCARCQSVVAELADERARLARDVPFEAFAAGVAEKLAQAQRAPRFARWAPLAAAAALLLVVGTSLTLRPPRARDDGLQTKGGAAVVLFQRSGAEVHRVDGPVSRGPLLVHLEPAGHRYAAVLLVEPQESSLLYAGAARTELPEAFEWTGTARKATLLAVFADEPLDGEALRRAGAKAAPRGADLVQVPLERTP
jgi:Putative zinc-finger